MKKIKSFIFSFIFLFCSFVPCFSVYAQGDEWTLQEKVRYVGNAFYKILTDISGVLVPSGLNGEDLQRDFQAYVLNSDVIQNNMSYDEWIASEIGISYENGSSGNAIVTYSPTFQNTINNFAHDWVEENTGYFYAYSDSADDWLSAYNDESDYNNLVSFLNSHSSDFIFVSQTTNGLQNKQKITQLYVHNNDTSPNLVQLSVDNAKTYVDVSVYDGWTSATRTSYTAYTYNFSTHTWNDGATPVNVYNPRLQYSQSSYSWNVSPVCISNDVKQYLVYKSFSALQQSNQGVQPYYITDSFNSNWQDNSITDSYNTTTTAINNTVTYQNVADYVNNYYVENNSYPTTNTVYNYINNYVPPNDDNGGNGGNGGSGSDFDWSFLGTIGDFLGGLISGIGDVLSGILSALTDVMDMFIGENGLPNIIGQLVEYFLPFLPDWVPPLIGFSVVLALLLGVIKLIRG